MEKEILKLSRFKIDRANYAEFPEVPGVYIYWQNNIPIYVGKSVNLRSRLSSYLNLNLGPKTKQMMHEAESVSYIKVTTELESLLLEAKLIRHYMPRYNIIAKDDKHPLYIAISKEEFPRVISVRKSADQDIAMKSLYGPFPNSTHVKTILKMIRRVFPCSDHKISKKPCLYSHLGLCEPCPNVVTRSQDKDFRLQKTKEYRGNIRNIKKLLDGKFSTIQKELLNSMQIYSKKQEYEEAAKIRSQLTSFGYILQPIIKPQEFIKNPNLEDDIKSKEIATLKDLLQYYYPDISQLRRIECFDIAHLSGVAATASMVVFIDGTADKSEYRHFKVRQTKSQGDYDSLAEIADRRIKNKEWSKADLIIVDGGLGQVKKFHDIVKTANIPVVGIAKNPDRLVFPDGKKIPAIKIMQQMRDEAHRFARRYHHLLLKKTLLS